MFIVDIVRHTPTWVFAVLAVLVVFGLSQTRARTVSLGRLAILPLALGAWSIHGVVESFGSGVAVAAWLAVVVVALAIGWALGPRRDVRYDADRRAFAIPGSVVPLVLMLAIFLSRYVIAVMLALHPDLHAAPVFAIVAGAVSGLASGIFAARATRTLRTALPAGRSATALA